MSYQRSLGSSQSRPSRFVRVSRGVALGSSQSRPSKFVRVARGFGSLGDATDAEPPTSLAQPTITTNPTIVDPTVQWQADMLAQTKLMVASQQDYAAREVQQKWIQIGATLLIPLSAAVWRAIGRLLAGRRSSRDFE